MSAIDPVLVSRGTRISKVTLRALIGLLLLAALGACADQGDDSASSEAATPQGPATAAQSLTATGQPTASAAQQAVTATAQAAAASVPGEQKAQTCLSCHSVENFKGFDVAKLEAAMQSMRTGEMAHLPLPASLTDQDLADIAAYLAEAANPAAAS